MDDQFEVELDDDDLLSEVELTTNLIIAATASDSRLSWDEIDRILGVVPRPLPPQQLANSNGPESRSDNT
ncbi:hypothetical protein GCM10028801_11030 [Nocardioides maradonensis]